MTCVKCMCATFKFLVLVREGVLQNMYIQTKFGDS